MNTILDVSNVSFGLPERELFTAAFFTIAMQSGLSFAIMNPNSAEMQKAYACFCALSGHDPQCQKYISFAEKYAVSADAVRIPAGSEVSAAAAKQSAPVIPEIGR